MPRKVFLSFLGTSQYGPTRYYLNKDDESADYENRFSQLAGLHFFCHDYNDSDQVYILLTADAIKNNWLQSSYLDNDKKTVEDTGLAEKLNGMYGVNAATEVNIGEMKTIPEIWEVFAQVIALLKDGDQLTIDVTHGFRSMPMLMTVLTGYAKLLKNVTVSHIYYAEYDRNLPRNPIIDLTPLADLQDWTSAAQMFLKAGYAEQLSALMEKDNDPMAQNLKKFTEDILVARGPSIIEGKESMAIRSGLTDAERKQANSIPPLEHILKKVESKFEGYEKDNVENMLEAIQWCIDHDLIQQGFTLMSEFIPTYVLMKVGEKKRIKDKNIRSFVHALLGYNPSGKPFNYDQFGKPEARKDLEKRVADHFEDHLYDTIKTLARDIGKLRNDINHAGFGNKLIGHKKFQGFLQTHLDRLRTWVANTSPPHAD